MTQPLISTSPEDAAALIRAGGLVAAPTETVYGLAADATNDGAVARIYEAKGRPSFNPLIVHFAKLDDADAEVEFSALALRLAEAFWPGPLTLVLPRRTGGRVSLLASAGLDTLGVRLPDHPMMRAMIKAAQRPVAAPSANRSGAISPTTPDHVRQSLGDQIDMILDGGQCSVGVESTIVKATQSGATLLRPGGLSREAIEDAIGSALQDPSALTAPEAPGMLTSHYAPAARFSINVKSPPNTEAFLDFGAIAPDHTFRLDLSPSSDLREAAANLFGYMRTLDDLCQKHELTGISAAPIPMRGLGEAINDRLKRAAATRE